MSKPKLHDWFKAVNACHLLCPMYVLQALDSTSVSAYKANLFNRKADTNLGNVLSHDWLWLDHSLILAETLLFQHASRQTACILSWCHFSPLPAWLLWSECMLIGPSFWTKPCQKTQLLVCLPALFMVTHNTGTELLGVLTSMMSAMLRHLACP